MNYSANIVDENGNVKTFDCMCDEFQCILKNKLPTDDLKICVQHLSNLHMEYTELFDMFMNQLSYLKRLKEELKEELETNIDSMLTNPNISDAKLIQNKHNRLKQLLY